MLKKIDYLPFLESCWQEHLLPREANAPTVISTFAGCGGSSLGYSMAGFKELLAIEWDDNAVATFKLNFPDVPVYHGDIAKISVEQVLEMTGLKVGELDVFDGSPPCQGFSTAGKRQFTDDRNQLFLEFSRLLRGLQPKVFVMENVSGMVKGKMKIIFAEILRELKSCGYQVSVKLLNAMYFNVPQSRQRLIFIGVRNDLDIQPSHPEAESIPVTVREAIGVNGYFEYGHHYSKNNVEIAQSSFDKPAITIRKTVSPNKATIEIPKWTDTRSNKWCDETLPGQTNERHFSIQRLADNKPSVTIPKSVTPNGSCQLLHPTEKRILSIDELKKISSYPDSFTFIGKFEKQWERIGNSVPPLFMRSIAKHIRGLLVDIQR